MEGERKSETEESRVLISTVRGEKEAKNMFIAMVGR